MNKREVLKQLFQLPKEDILDIKYYHIVMLLPRELYPLFYYNQRKIY